MTRSALLVANSRAGGGRSVLDPALEVFAAAGVAVDVCTPEDPAQIPAIVRERGPAADMVVVGGGDGTVHRVAAALIDAGRPFGLLPMGTANDLARTLALPVDPAAAAAVIVAGTTTRVDVGMLNGSPFLNVVSIGLSVQVAKYHSGERKRRLRLLSYPVSWLDAWRESRPFSAWLTCDGDTLRVRCLQVTVGNGRHYGGGLTVAPDARIDDGRLDVYYVKPVPAWRMARLLPALFSGNFRARGEVGSFSGRQVRIATRRPLPINADGELIGETPAEIEVRPGALEVFVP